jgi:CheY-like chemotaxis protein
MFCLIAAVRMPGMTRLHLCHRLVTAESPFQPARKRPILTTVLVLYDGARERAFSAGIGYLAKPIEQDDLLACARSVQTHTGRGRTTH